MRGTRDARSTRRRTDGLARRRRRAARRGRRASVSALLQAAHVAAARAACCARTSARSGCWSSLHRRAERSPRWPARCLVGLGIDRGIPPLMRRPRTPARSSPWSSRSRVATVDPVVSRARVPGAHRADRPGRRCSTCAAGCSTTSSGCRQAFHEQLHLGPGHLPADLRHRRASPSCSTTACRRSCVAGLSVVTIGIILLLLDLPLALVALAVVPAAARGSSRWFRRDSAHGLPAHRARRSPLVIVQFVESLGGIRAVQAFRREPRNEEIFAQLNEDYRRDQRARVQADRGLRAGRSC